MNTHADSHHVIGILAHSPVYLDYERAFNELTGLPVNLRPVESWQLPHHGRRNENPFCALMAERSRTCGACLRTQQQLTEAAMSAPATVGCQFGLCESAVPVRTGEKTIGFLQTGQVFRRKPTEAQFERAATLARDGGVTTSKADLRTAYFNTPVVPAKRHAAALSLLNSFASHLATVSNQFILRTAQAESPLVRHAKQFIAEHYTEQLSLGTLAGVVHVSTYYFCKLFKQGTGLTFTDYLARFRFEQAKNLLLNPHVRISEVAYAAGFRSLTHFNRTFKRLAGQSPTDYRSRLPAA
jgi:AraC-like DNA-binding protein